MSDTLHRFLFEQHDIRGAVVQLETSWQAMLAGRNYNDVAQALLGETAAVAALITSQLKTPGRLIFQVQGKGPLSMLIVDCDESLRLRGMAKSQPYLPPAGVAELIGDGRLMLSVQTQEARQPYQSYVPLEGDSIAAIFENYLHQSEQQATRLWLFADAERACGLFLQTLPASGPTRHTQDDDAWNRVQHLAATIRPEEFALPAAELLGRLFAEEEVRLFEPRPVVYYCPRDEAKVRDMLSSLGHRELAQLIDERGEILIQDEICNHEYRFGPEILDELFPSGGQVLH